MDDMKSSDESFENVKKRSKLCKPRFWNENELQLLVKVAGKVGAQYMTSKHACESFIAPQYNKKAKEFGLPSRTGAACRRRWEKLLQARGTGGGNLSKLEDAAVRLDEAARKHLGLRDGDESDASQSNYNGTSDDDTDINQNDNAANDIMNESDTNNTGSSGRHKTQPISAKAKKHWCNTQAAVDEAVLPSASLGGQHSLIENFRRSSSSSAASGSMNKKEEHVLDFLNKQLAQERKQREEDRQERKEARNEAIIAYEARTRVLQSFLQAIAKKE